MEYVLDTAHQEDFSSDFSDNKKNNFFDVKYVYVFCPETDYGHTHLKELGGLFSCCFQIVTYVVWANLKFTVQSLKITLSF